LLLSFEKSANRQRKSLKKCPKETKKRFFFPRKCPPRTFKVVSDKVAALRQKLFQAKRKAETLVKDAEDCQIKLGRAEELLKG
jgi:hypothetical protein